MKFILTLTTVALLFAGCTGVPAGGADYGDQVTVNWTAYDPDTNQPVSQGSNLQFVMGSGLSGLGFEFERQLIGAVEGDDLDFNSDNDPSRDYTTQVSVDRLLEQPITGDVPRASFESQFGAAVLNEEYDFGIYSLRAVAVSNETVTYRYVFVDGQEDAVEFVGATLISRDQGDTLLQELVPVVGATFVIQPPSPFNPNTPLGLEPGSYRSVGYDDTQIKYDYSAASDASLLGVPLRFEVSVLTVVPAAPAEYNEDSFTTRNSPQLLADPAHVKHTSLTEAPGEDHSDHGHTH